MLGDGLKDGSKTSKFRLPLLLISMPIIVSEWPWLG